MWLSGLSTGLWTKRLLVWFLVRAHAWVVGQVPGWVAQLSPHFKSLALLPISKLGPSGADSQVGGLVYILGPCGSLQWPFLWGWEFFLPLQPPQIFTARGFEASVSQAGTLVSMVCLVPQLFLLVYLHVNVGLPCPPAATLLLTAPAAQLRPSYQSGWSLGAPPLLPVFLLSLFGCQTSI